MMSEGQIVEEFTLGRTVRRIVIRVEGIPGGGIHITSGLKGVQAGPYDINGHQKRVLCELIEIPNHIASIAITLVLNQLELDERLLDIETLTNNPQLPA